VGGVTREGGKQLLKVVAMGESWTFPLRPLPPTNNDR